MSRRGELLRLLADGAVHSGEELAGALAVSRAAVWKQLRQLGGWGLDVQAMPGRGYRLSQPLDFLDAARLRSLLPPGVSGRLRRLDVLETCDSTSDRLLAVDDLPAGCFDACLAEFQSAGRGRRGRRWLAPFGSGICLSLACTYEGSPATLGALSLAAGVAVVRALACLGLPDAGLKWPNDIVCAGAKLGGILVDLRGEVAGPTRVVVGVGLNVSLPGGVRDRLAAEGAAAADLASLGALRRRTDVAAALVAGLVAALDEFGARGFPAFVDEWARADALAGRNVRVLSADRVIEGVAQGVDADGALRVETPGGVRRILTGEVSVRPVGAAG